MREDEIIEKLQPTLLREGLEVTYLGREGSIVNIRAKRVAPGVPVAFLLKAIAGTFRRYLPEIEDVCLTEYDPGEGIETAPSETFEPVFSHRPISLAPSLVGLPVLDLRGLDRKEAVRAIERFVRAWKSRSPMLGIRGLLEDAPGRAARKWAAVYADDYRALHERSGDRWDLQFDGDLSPLQSFLDDGREEVMPGSIYLTENPSEEHKS